MNKFSIVKQTVNIVDVARRYGIAVNRAGKASCPFHTEKTASFSINKNKQIFKCFGCGVGGDAITLVSKLFGVSPFESAKIINSDFGCGIDFGKPVSKYSVTILQHKQERVKEFEKWIDNAFDILATYFKRMNHWLEIFRPIMGQEMHPLFIEALENKDKIEDWLLYLINSTNEQKIVFWKLHREAVSKIEHRLGR